MKKIYYMLLLAVLAVTMTSCDGWNSPYRIDSIVGSWESYYGYNGQYEYDILGQDVVRYDFYANHTGRYTFYDRWYGLSYVDFDWETYSDRLIIRYDDGDSDYLQKIRFCLLVYPILCCLPCVSASCPLHNLTARGV